MAAHAMTATARIKKTADTEAEAIRIVEPSQLDPDCSLVSAGTKMGCVCCTLWSRMAISGTAGGG